MKQFHLICIFNKDCKILGSYFTCIVIILFFGITSCYANPNSRVDAKLQKLIDTFRIKSNAPAAVLSVNFPGNNIANFVSGTIEKKSPAIENPNLVTTNNLFQIGSITKSFTAVIILQLEAEEKISLKQTIKDITQKYGAWLPQTEYQTWKNISIIQLLNMTSGIFDITEDKAFMQALANDPQKEWTPQEILDYSYKHNVYFLPGAGWHYTNSAYNILGLLIEKVTHRSFEDEINTRLLKKYDLTNTFYLPYAYSKCILKRMAHGYVYHGGGFSPPLRAGDDMTRANMSAAGPSGALVSNSIDITKWVRLIFSNNFLPTLQMHELKTVVCTGEDNTCRAGKTLSVDDLSQGYSLGLMRIYDPKLGHIWVYFGDTPGYSSGFIWLPKQKIALAMTISATSKNGKKLLKQLSEVAKLIQN